MIMIAEPELMLRLPTPLPVAAPTILQLVPASMESEPIP